MDSVLFLWPLIGPEGISSVILMMSAAHQELIKSLAVHIYTIHLFGTSVLFDILLIDMAHCHLGSIHTQKAFIEKI